MKKASKYLKQLFSVIVAAVKARSMAVGTKAGSLRTRLVVLSIMRNKKLLLSAIQSKIHAIMGGGHRGAYSNNAAASASSSRHVVVDGGDDIEGATDDRGGAGEHGRGDDGRRHHHHLGRKAAVLQNLPSFVVDQETRAVVLLSSLPSFALEREGSGGEEAEDNDDDNIGGKELAVDAAALPGSAVELARCAAEGAGAEFRLEDEIDRVADVFIRRFHDQMKLQKLESFKRFCEMLERGA